MRVWIPSLLLLAVAIPKSVMADDAGSYSIEHIEVRNDKERKPDFMTRDGERIFVVPLRFDIFQGNEKANDLGPRLAEEMKKSGAAREMEIKVFEDGHEVKNVRLTNWPTLTRVENRMSIVLVIDCSGSMKDKASEKDDTSKIMAMRQAASAFIDRLPPQASVSLLPFSDKVGRITLPSNPRDSIDLGRPAPFSSDKTSLKESIGKLEPLGGTLLYDAIHDAVETLDATHRPGQRAVVVLTDGKDESPGSRYAPSEVIQRSQEAQTPLYLLGLGREREINEPIMREMARETKGRYQRASNQNELFSLFSGLAEEFQGTPNAFELEYDSPRSSNDGTARGISITLVRKHMQISNTAKAEYATRGVVVPAMNPFLYLPLLGLLGGLLLVPYGIGRLNKLTSRSSS